MIAIGDPVRAGFVASLARPGGNITGNTILGPEVAAKRLQLFKLAVATMSRVAFPEPRRRTILDGVLPWHTFRPMNRVQEQKHLAQANRHIAELKADIARQRAIV
jgi:hypothetical protein